MVGAMEITPTELGYRVKGELDMATSDELGAVLKSARSGPVHLDFTEVTFMDSSGLRALLDAAGSIEGGIVLRHPSPQVQKVLNISIPTGAPGLEVLP